MAKKPAQIPGAAAVTETPADAAPEPATESGAPNAIDVDARYLRGPVLTKQGWVVPDEDWQKANRAAFDAHWAAKG